MHYWERGRPDQEYQSHANTKRRDISEGEVQSHEGFPHRMDEQI